MKTGRPAAGIKPRRLPPWRDDHDSVLAYLRWIRTEYNGGRLSSTAATVHSAIASKATTTLSDKHKLNEVAELRDLVARQETARASVRAAAVAELHSGGSVIGEITVTDEEPAPRE